MSAAPMPWEKYAQQAPSTESAPWTQYSDTPKEEAAPNAGLAPPAAPPMGAEAAKTMTSGEGPIARTMTSAETQASKIPGAMGRMALAKRWPIVDAKNWSELGHDVRSMNPIVTNEGQPVESLKDASNIDYGASAVNALPFVAGGMRALRDVPVGRVARATGAGAGEAVLHTPIVGPPLRALGRGFMRSWTGAEPPSTYSGAPLPEAPPPEAALARPVTTGSPSSSLGRIAMRSDPYANVDAIRAKMTAVPRESLGLGELPATGLPQSEVLGRLGTTAGERAAEAAFMRSNPSALERVPTARPGTAGTMAESISAKPSPHGVTLIPEPRAPFSGENPNYMASVPREGLGKMALARKPGAGVQMQQLGEPVLYVPKEAGFPGPRPQTAGTVAGAMRDTEIMARLAKEHPEWSLSQRLQEAAKIANPK